MFFWGGILLLSEVQDVGRVEMSLLEGIVTKTLGLRLKGFYIFLYLLFSNGRDFHWGTQTGSKVIDSDFWKYF
jgi:hypothetical protein